MGYKSAVRMLLCGCSAIGFTCYPSVAQAQVANTVAPEAPPATAEDSDAPADGDIIVTAQRRDQRLQDVPIAVSVVDSTALQASNVTGLTDIQFLSPGVTFNTNFNASFLIRGVGTSSLLMTAEQSVGVVIDDVVQGIVETTFAGPSYQSLNDVERIEVLKGPQGTLFGKNSSAGVVQIITRNPKLGESSMNASFSYGRRNEANVQAAVNVPLGDTLALRVAGTVQRRDGFIRNTFTGDDLYAYQRYGIRAKLLWQPTDRLTMLLSGDYRQADDNANGAWTLRNCGSGLILFGARVYSPCASLAPYGVQAGPENQRVALDGPTFTEQTSQVASLRIDYDVGGATLTSITAYRDLNQDIAVDTDASPRYIYSINRNPSGGTQFTQELRATGEFGIVNYTLGAIYYKAKPFQEAINISTLGVIPDDSPFGFSQSAIGPGATSGYLPTVRAENESWAIFGQVEAALTEDFTLIGGLRYTNDHVRQTITYYDVPGVCALGAYLTGRGCHISPTPPAPSFAQTSADKFTYKVTAKYDFTPDINVYATYSTGYKGPMISYPSGQPQQLVRPETVESYELGLKSQLFDRRVLFNLALFQADFSDFQAQQRVIDPLDSSRSYYTTTNAGSLKTRGVEADLSFRVTPEFTLTGNVAYIPTEFTDYAIQCETGFTNPGTPPGQCTYVPPGSPAGTAPAFNAAGYPLVYAPEWTFGVSGNLDVPVGNSNSVTASATFNWRSETYGEVADPNTINEGYGLLNGQIGYGAEDGSWRLSVWGRNLLDRYFVAGIFTTPFDTGLSGTTPLSTRGYSNNPAIDSSRTIGLKLEVRFGN